MFYDAKQRVVRVMPGVTGTVMRRGRQLAVGLAYAPVRLTFQVFTVAERAKLIVDPLAVLYLILIMRIHLDGIFSIHDLIGNQRSAQQQ